jgi:hypothetical protein
VGVKLINMEMHKDYDKMEKQIDRISWLLDQDALSK